MLIVTIPPPYKYNAGVIASITSAIDGFRFNTGVAIPTSPKETLEGLLKLIGNGRDLWVDLKCRQLRVAKWADPSYSEIELNRAVEVELPAKICFRGDHECQIGHVDGKKIFLVDPPRQCVGKGQSVNILTSKLIVKGNLFTDLDQEYLAACKELGIDTIMCSFVETWDDVTEIVLSFPGQIYFKIESLKGLGLVDPSPGMHFEAARDDLFIELEKNPKEMLDALANIIRADSKAIAASRFFTGLKESGEISMSDLTDIVWLLTIGYRNFLFQDSLSDEPVVLRKAIESYYRCCEWVLKEQV
jgi:hypothetical protein